MSISRSGNRLEYMVSALLEHDGYRRVPADINQRSARFGAWYMTQVWIPRNLHGRRSRLDVLFGNADIFPVPHHMELKWQQSSGSVDEKFTHIVHNAGFLADHYGFPTMTILDGNGYAQESGQWLRRQVRKDGPLIGVFTLAELLAEANRGFFQGAVTLPAATPNQPQLLLEL